MLCSRWLSQTELAELYWFSEVVEKFCNTRYFPTLWRYLRQSGDDPFAFFHGLLQLCRERGLFARAATQELLCALLSEMIAGRDDAGLLGDVLRYDWLRCGFHFLPDCLSEGLAESPEETRSRLYQRLPGEMPGLYDRAGRNHFFRKAFFLRWRPETVAAAAALGLPPGEVCCVSLDKDGGLFGLQRVVGLPETSPEPERC